MSVMNCDVSLIEICFANKYMGNRANEEIDYFINEKLLYRNLKCYRYMTSNESIHKNV